MKSTNIIARGKYEEHVGIPDSCELMGDTHGLLTELVNMRDAVPFRFYGVQVSLIAMFERFNIVPVFQDENGRLDLSDCEDNWEESCIHIHKRDSLNVFRLEYIAKYHETRLIIEFENV